MKLLIGYTGLIGKTISEQETFDHFFNSKNIKDFSKIAKDGDELFLTCLPSTKWKVNQNLKDDYKNINKIIDKISNQYYSKVTLISTIDVYNDSPLKSDETYSPNISKLSYGNNRYIFELLVKEFVRTSKLQIFRLPALFNKHIKKNVLYDLIYNNNVNKINTNSSYQWYNLDNLSKDIQMRNNDTNKFNIFNLFTEPINTLDIVSLFPNHISTVTHLNDNVTYDYKTIYGGYIETKEDTLNEIKKFINEFSFK